MNFAALTGLADALTRAARYGHDGAVRAECQRDAIAYAAALENTPVEETSVPGLTDAFTRAMELAGRGAAELATMTDSPESVMVVMRAARYVAYVMELLYPFTRDVPALDAWFSLDGVATDASHAEADVGVGHFANERGSKGGCSLYVPETYDANGAPLPIIIALHGGAGHGRTFVWSWLRHARSRACIVLSPTSVGDTWALMEPEADVANLTGMVEWVASRWHIDSQRVLLTGMSDGGTFSLLAGLRDAFPCTHVAPIAASFHPVMLEMVSRERVQSTPLHLTHGRYDWMFPVGMAREAEQCFRSAGGQVELSELDDLAHTYPHEHNAALLDWFLTPPA